MQAASQPDVHVRWWRYWEPNICNRQNALKTPDYFKIRRNNQINKSAALASGRPNGPHPSRPDARATPPTLLASRTPPRLLRRSPPCTGPSGCSRQLRQVAPHCNMHNTLLLKTLSEVGKMNLPRRPSQPPQAKYHGKSNLYRDSSDARLG
jgi:hypothetical protein